MQRNLITTLAALAISAVPFAAKADAGVDESLLPKARQSVKAATNDSFVIRTPRAERPLPSAFDAANNAQ